MQISTTRSRPRFEQRALSLVLTLLLGLLGGAGVASAGGRELSDAELDEVVAGVVDTQVEEYLWSFSYAGRAGANHMARVDGTLSLGGPLTNPPTGLLIIDNGAQTNLRSVVNVNAVNSEVNVLLNLNININSTVGELRQINIRTVP